MAALEDVMFKLLLFASLGGLLARGMATILQPSCLGKTDEVRGKIISRQSLRRLLLPGVAILGCAVWATIIELLQVYLPPHVPDLTDVLTAIAGAWLGIMALTHVCQSKRPP